MSISIITPPNDWLLISTTPITTTAASVNFTSLANYSAYLVFVSATTTVNSTTLACRPNGSTSDAHYATPVNSAVQFQLTIVNQAEAKTAAIAIYDALTTTPKKITAAYPTTANGESLYFFDGAPITSITIKPSSGNFNSTGTIYLFGKL
jgi:hypothetical protein